MQRSDPWTLVLAAWVLAVIATLGSLRYSGVGFLGWHGLGLPPCELCWYQRILMYPLAGVLGVATLRRQPAVARLALGFSVPGVVLASYHSLIQYLPHLEAGQCIVGSCTSVYYRVVGLTIPNQSLVAFTGITALLGMWWYVVRTVGDGDEAEDADGADGADEAATEPA